MFHPLSSCFARLAVRFLHRLAWNRCRSHTSPALRSLLPNVPLSCISSASVRFLGTAVLGIIDVGHRHGCEHLVRLPANLFNKCKSAAVCPGAICGCRVLSRGERLQRPGVSNRSNALSVAAGGLAPALASLWGRPHLHDRWAGDLARRCVHDSSPAINPRNETSARKVASSNPAGLSGDCPSVFSSRGRRQRQMSPPVSALPALSFSPPSINK